MDDDKWCPFHILGGCDNPAVGWTIFVLMVFVGTLIFWSV